MKLKGQNRLLKKILTLFLFFSSQIGFAFPRWVVQEIYDEVKAVKASVLYTTPAESIEIEALFNDSVFQRSISPDKADLAKLKEHANTPEFRAYIRLLQAKLKSSDPSGVADFFEQMLRVDAFSVFRKLGLFVDLDSTNSDYRTFREILQKAWSGIEMSELEFTDEELVPIRAIQEEPGYVKRSLSDSDLKRLADLVKQFVTQVTPHVTEMRMSNHNLYNIFDQSGEPNLVFLQLLDIELPIEKIEEIFHKYSVIQLRPLQSERLVVGCGNLPLQVGCRAFHSSVGLMGFRRHQEFFTGYQRRHAHEGNDTIDIDIRMNPTVVGLFGKDRMTQFFQEQGKFYKEIEPEAVFVEGDEEVENAKKALTAL
jgi:hypothetical protein